MVKYPVLYSIQENIFLTMDLDSNVSYAIKRNRALLENVGYLNFTLITLGLRIVLNDFIRVVIW